MIAYFCTALPGDVKGFAYDFAGEGVEPAIKNNS
jgi:hypothetical protein